MDAGCSWTRVIVSPPRQVFTYGPSVTPPYALTRRQNAYQRTKKSSIIRDITTYYRMSSNRHPLHPSIAYIPSIISPASSIVYWLSERCRSLPIECLWKKSVTYFPISSPPSQDIKYTQRLAALTSLSSWLNPSVPSAKVESPSSFSRAWCLAKPSSTDLHIWTNGGDRCLSLLTFHSVSRSSAGPNWYPISHCSF